MIGKGEKGTATHERDIFIGCLRRRSLQERRHYLVIACGLDWSLLRRIQELLNTQRGLGDFLEQPAFSLPHRIEAGPDWRRSASNASTP